ncbi:MAG: hypothetical protein WCB63_02500 [Polyangiales bacterium]|jgi:hypothetical protein
MSGAISMLRRSVVEDHGVLVAAGRGRGVPLRITAKSLHAYLERTGAL